MHRLRLTHGLALLAVFFSGGCSTLKNTAVNQLGDALAAGGTTYATDDDPELVKAAAPFSLKLMESLLAENPTHRGLLLAATSGFTQYSYAFVQQDADEVEAENVSAATALRQRAARLYLRAHDYGLRGLATVHPDFISLLRSDPHATVQLCTPDDVPLLYWTAASWFAAIALGKDQPALVAELPMAEALIDRALQLGEDFDHGAIHTLLISYEMSRPGGSGDPAVRAEEHFNRAVALGGDDQAAPFVAFAEAVCVQQQNHARFQSLLTRALAINADSRPEFRLLNLVMQRRARWLLTLSDELFLAPVNEGESKS